MTEQKAGLDRELWARIGEIADAYSKKEMAADIAAASAWEADIQKGANIATELARQLRTAEARIEALEKVRSAGEALWPYVFRVMPAKGRFRQAAEMFYDALTALAKGRP